MRKSLVKLLKGFKRSTQKKKDRERRKNPQVTNFSKKVTVFHKLIVLPKTITSSKINGSSISSQ